VADPAAPASPTAAETGDRVARGSLAVMLVHVPLKLLGLVSRVALNNVFGKELLDAFTAAYDGVMSIYSIGEDALGHAFLPVYQERRNLESDAAAGRFASTVMTLVAIVIVPIVAVLLLWPRQVFALVLHESKTSLAADTAEIAPVIALGLIGYALSTVTYKILNGHKRFFAAALGDLAWRMSVLAMVPVAAFIAWRTGGAPSLWWVAAGAAAGGFLRLAVHLLALRRRSIGLRPRLELRDPAVGKFLLLLSAPLIGSIIAKGRDYYNQMYVLSVIEESGLIAMNKNAKAIVDTVQFLVPLAVGIALFPFFCDLVDRKDVRRFGEVMTRAMRILLLVFAPMAAVLILLAGPISDLVFHWSDKVSPSDVGMIAASFSGYVIAIPAMAAEAVIVQGYYSSRRMLSATVIGIIFAFFSVGLSSLGIYGFGAQGVAALLWVATGFAAARLLKILVMVLFLRRSIPLFPARESISFFARLLIFCAVIAAAAWASREAAAAAFARMLAPGSLLGGKAAGALIIASVSAASIAAGLISAKLLRFEELDIARGWLREKLRGRKENPQITQK
jgi:putative peptidoglycan lipid II flippase